MSGAALDAIAADADTLGADTQQPGGQAQGQGGPEAVQQSPNIGAIAFMLTTFREVACLFLKVESPRVTLSEANCQLCAEAIAPVADKYGLDLRQYLQGSVEATAVVVAGPILWAAARELQAELAARRAKPIDAEAVERADAPAGGAE